MTLVIRAASELVAPLPYSKVIAPMAGVTGVFARYHADSFTQVQGTTVSRWDTVAGTPSHSLTPFGTGGTAVQDISLAKRAVSLVGTASTGLKSSPVEGFPTGFTLGVRIYATEAATTSGNIIAGADLGVTLNLGIRTATTRRFASAGYDTSPSLNASAATAMPGWVTIVATFDPATSAAKITVDGVTTTGTHAYTLAMPNKGVKLTPSTHPSGIKFRQVIFLDHVAGDTEIGALTTGLTND